jgi:hypothetical protein
MSMARFTVRVELHKAESDDYDALHDAMKEAGFKDTIQNDEGVSFQLPPAEYNYVGEATRQQVLNKAVAAAKTTGKKSSTLVTESAGRVWDSLSRA